MTTTPDTTNTNPNRGSGQVPVPRTPRAAAQVPPETDAERTTPLMLPPLPAAGAEQVPGTELVPEPIEGELVSPEESAEIDRRMRVRHAVGRVIPRAPVRVDPARMRAQGRTVARHVGYTRTGAQVLAQRWADSHGTARFERQMRAAEAAGDTERLAEWTERAEKAKRERHDRKQALRQDPFLLVKRIGGLVAALVLVLVIAGVLTAVAYGDVSAFLEPFTGFLWLVRQVATIIAAATVPVLIGAPIAGLVTMWAVGRSHDPNPRPQRGEFGVPEGSGRDVVPDEGAIMSALRNLNVSQLNRKIKEGWQPRWPSPTTRDGHGYRTQLELPQSVTVEMIVNRKDVLAHNLVRLPVEVWPTEPKDKPGVLDLWVADQGVLTGPVPDYPLLLEGSCDYFKGVPVGIDQRGDVIKGKLMACNYGIAGTMGSGKTSLVISLLAGASLDPLVDIEVYVMAYNADYDAFTPRLNKLVKGDEDEQVKQAMDALRNLRGEVTERGKILSSLGGELKLTRAIAEADARMRPRVVVIDECQEMFRHEQFGEEAKELAIKVMMKARKVGITLIFVTPVPSASSLPRDLAKTTSHQVCFAIGDHQGNDAILGTGSHKAGITATTLVPGEDIGTAMAAGFAKRPGLLRAFHIKKDANIDQITPIIDRALAARDQAGIDSAGQAPALEPADELDPLADIDAVLAANVGREGRMRTQEVLTALAIRNAEAYGAWTFTDLAAALPEVAKPYKSHGWKVIAADRVREAITERDDEEGSETESEEFDT